MNKSKVIIVRALASGLALALTALTPSCKKGTAEPDWSTSFTGCDVKSWPQSLPIAKRSQKERINVTFYESQKAPTASDSFKRQQLSEEQKAANTALSRIRIFIEHAIGGMKRSNILVHTFRNRIEHFEDDVIGICAGLWNLVLSY